MLCDSNITTHPLAYLSRSISICLFLSFSLFYLMLRNFRVILHRKSWLCLKNHLQFTVRSIFNSNLIICYQLVVPLHFSIVYHIEYKRCKEEPALFVLILMLSECDNDNELSIQKTMYFNNGFICVLGRPKMHSTKIERVFTGYTIYLLFISTAHFCFSFHSSLCLFHF